jgi:hypothetical protein
MISLKRSIFVIIAVAATCTFSFGQRLQVPQVSQKASVMQRIGLSEVSVTYSRPAAKGRKIYGDWPVEVKGEETLDNQNTRPAGAPLVPWGHVWRAGANEATVFETSDDILVNGQPLGAGRYLLAAVPGKEGEWTIIFNKDADQWGTFSYEAAKDVLRVKTKAQPLTESEEFLTYTIDGMTPDTAQVNLRWEKLQVPFTVKVPDVQTKALAKIRAQVAAAKPDDVNTPSSAAGFARSMKATEDATKFAEAALRAVDLRLKAKEDFANLRAKSNILFSLGRNEEAIAVGEKAVSAGKAEKADAAALGAFEKRVNDAKAAATKPSN